MKRLLSFIIAVLLMASSFASCGQKKDPEIKPAETKRETSAVDTTDAETETPETDAASSTYACDTVTENGIAKAHIVVPEAADDLLSYGAEELAYHIKLVSGAEVPVTDTANDHSLPIIIATPDSNPELEEMFPEDLSWLRDLGNPAEDTRWGDDGFAIRLTDGKLYIFGATSRGALNGVYDFIEDNLGVLWIRAENMSEYATIYDEMPTITVDKIDYADGHREKSPFDLRSWTQSGNSLEHQTLLSRNKMNAFVLHPASIANYTYDDVGLDPFVSSHNLKWWVQNSPSYDPNCTEYWSTNIAGEHVSSPSASLQVNYWSDLTLHCIADHIISYLDQYKEAENVEYIGVCIEDFDKVCVYPEMNEAFEYAPGQYVEAGTNKYISTVFYTFLNKLTRLVNEKYPDVKLHSYAYAEVIEPPVCEIEENLFITFCPLSEDLCSPIGESQRSDANIQYAALLGWMELTPNVQVYNYYGCFTAAPIFERPIWYRIQSDLQLYAANGFNGLVPEGFADMASVWCVDPTYGIVNDVREPYLRMNNGWAMNAMTFWIYSKLSWNPNEDVDALIRYYCDKVYGDASEYMLEYYRLLELGWEDGRESMALEFNLYYRWSTTPDIYWDYFLNIEVDGVNIYEAIVETLHKAYEAADEVGKEHLRYIVEVYDNAEELFPI